PRAGVTPAEALRAAAPGTTVQISARVPNWPGREWARTPCCRRRASRRAPSQTATAATIRVGRKSRVMRVRAGGIERPGSPPSSAAEPARECSADYDGAMTVLLRRRGPPGVSRRRLRGCDREIGGEARALPRGAFHGQPAAMAVDDMLDDGEAQAGAGPFAALLAFDAVEPLRQPRQVLAVHARSVIAHRHGGVAQAGLAGRGDQRHRKTVV